MPSVRGGVRLDQPVAFARLPRRGFAHCDRYESREGSRVPVSVSSYLAMTVGGGRDAASLAGGVMVRSSLG